tara:strand:+ start:2172 stop:4487 length:2316 start_codon:yes stop_codon:yes gene_type:complete
MSVEKLKKNINKFLLFDAYWPQYITISILIVTISFLFPKGKGLQYKYQLNDISYDPIIAPFTFPILKSSEKLKNDLDERKKSIPYAFNRDYSSVDSQLIKLSDFFEIVEKIRRNKVRLDESRRLVYERRYHKQYEKANSEFVSDSTNLSVLNKQFNNKYPFTLERKDWQLYLSNDSELSSLSSIDKDKELIMQICRNRWAEGIYDIPIKDIISNKVNVSQGLVPDLAIPKSFNDLENAWIKSRKELISLLPEKSTFLDLGYDLIVEFMKPNLLFDFEDTKRRQKESLDKVPRSKGVVLKNELIVDANMRITEDILLKLNSLSAAVTNQEAGTGFIKTIQGFAGRFILTSIIISLFFAFLVVYRKNIFSDWKMVLLISSIFFIQLTLSHIVIIQTKWPEYIIPITMGAMTLTILFDARIGFMATTSLAIFMGIMMGQNIDFIIISLFTATIAIYNIRELRKRSQLFTTMFALIAASTLAVLGIGLFKGNSWAIMFRDMQFLILNSILAPILTYGLIGFFEMIFDVTTDLTLIELLDYDHPLLKEAQRETNGTFNHSVVVGNLAEACAKAIGAHSLLCRVGAYYHDIGKMKKSEYFIENQYGGKNKHDKITNTMSARIIRAHVNDGLRLAQEYGLPKIVSDFIPMHHGTTRVEYFYRLALKEAAEKGEKVDESAFRYPGPKPNTKETGILMICEAVEAAVRSIKEPDIFKIEAMIDKIINQRIEDGQLNECPLTLDELNRIKGKVDGTSGMLPVLRGIYHIRVEYPNEPKASS